MIKNLASENTMAVNLKDLTANPAPLGLMGFGLTTILLNLHNVGLFAIGSAILSTGLFYGGLAQIIVGIMEWKKKNTFGTVAFTSYGLFWITLVSILLMPKLGLATSPTPTTMGIFLTLWGIFTLGMFIGTFKLNRHLQFVFGLLAALFFLLAIADFTGNATIKLIAGIVGIIDGAAAMYVGFHQILSELYVKQETSNEEVSENKENSSNIHSNELSENTFSTSALFAEYNKAYYQLKSIDLRPIKKLMDMVSHPEFIDNVENGRSIQKKTMQSIASFVSSRSKLLKMAPDPDEVTESTNMKEIILAINAVCLSANTLSNDTLEKINLYNKQQVSI
jgi:succinate-acetate transporter protein